MKLVHFLKCILKNYWPKILLKGYLYVSTLDTKIFVLETRWNKNPCKDFVYPGFHLCKNKNHSFALQFAFNCFLCRQTDHSNSATFVWLNTGKDIISRGKQTSQINDISVIHIWFPRTTELTITLFPWVVWMREWTREDNLYALLCSAASLSLQLLCLLSSYGCN